MATTASNVPALHQMPVNNEHDTTWYCYLSRRLGISFLTKFLLLQLRLLRIPFIIPYLISQILKPGTEEKVSINQSINQSIYQSINLSTNHSFIHSFIHSFKFRSKMFVPKTGSQPSLGPSQALSFSHGPPLSHVERHAIGILARMLSSDSLHGANHRHPTWDRIITTPSYPFSGNEGPVRKVCSRERSVKILKYWLIMPLGLIYGKSSGTN